jgi:hypothetical protein
MTFLIFKIEADKMIMEKVTFLFIKYYQNGRVTSLRREEGKITFEIDSKIKIS